MTCWHPPARRRRSPTLPARSDEAAVAEPGEGEVAAVPSRRPPPSSGTNCATAPPIPPAAECTSTVSPAVKRPASVSRSRAVARPSGVAAAELNETASGTGTVSSARAVAISAKPPPPSATAAIRSPTARPVTSAPNSRTVPAISNRHRWPSRPRRAAAVPPRGSPTCPHRRGRSSQGSHRHSQHLTTVERSGSTPRRGATFRPG